MGMMRRLGNLFRRSRVESEIDAELRAHLEMAAEDAVRAGMSEDEARRAARVRFGNPLVVRERTLGTDAALWVEGLWRDVRYALRQMRKSPGFTATVVLTLALGIGAAAAMFTVVDHVLLQPVPYKSAGRLVKIIETARKGDGWAQPSWPDIQAWRSESRLFAGIGFSRKVYGSAFLIGNHATVQVRSYEVSPSLFRVLGVQPELGRGFAAEANGKAASADANTVVLSNAIWRTEFGANRGILGKVVRINNSPYTVIGVMPAGFRYPAGRPEGTYAAGAEEVWVPAQIGPKDLKREPGVTGYDVVARLKQGVSLKSARAGLAVVQKRIAAEYSNARERRVRAGVKITPYADALVNADVRKALLALLAAAGVLWLIASLNMTNLLLARATARQREIAMRGALGASRWRVAQQMMVEGLLLSAGAAVLGGALAFGSVAMLAHELRTNLPLPVPARPDTWILVALTGMTVVSALISTAWPALLAARAPIESALRQGGMQAGTGHKQHRLRGTLVAAEVALSLMLLVMCGLLLRTIYTLRHVPLGYRTDHILVAHLVIPSYRYKGEDLTQVLYKPLLERVQQVHGVEAAGLMNEVPLGKTFGIELSLPMNGHMVRASLKPMTPGIQRVFGMKMLAGRFFNQEDTPTSEPVAIVNPAFVREYAPNKHDPRSILGAQFWSPVKGQTARIIGVLDNERQTKVSMTSQPEIEICLCQVTKKTGIYWPFTTAMDIAVRTQQPEAVMIPQLRDVLRQADPGLAQAPIMTMDQIAADSYGSQRLAAHLLEVFGGVALLLCVAGLYGLLAYVVSQRMRELAVRVALGAQRSNLVWMVMRQAGAMLAVGIVAGCGLAWVSAAVVRGFLYGVQAHNGWILAAASLLMLVSGLVAAYLPARRAAGVDPMRVLRME